MRKLLFKFSSRMNKNTEVTSSRKIRTIAQKKNISNARQLFVSALHPRGQALCTTNPHIRARSGAESNSVSAPRRFICLFIHESLSRMNTASRACSFLRFVHRAMMVVLFTIISRVNVASCSCCRCLSGAPSCRCIVILRLIVVTVWPM